MGEFQETGKEKEVHVEGQRKRRGASILDEEETEYGDNEIGETHF